MHGTWEASWTAYPPLQVYHQDTTYQDTTYHATTYHTTYQDTTYHTTYQDTTYHTTYQDTTYHTTYQDTTYHAVSMLLSGFLSPLTPGLHWVNADERSSNGFGGNAAGLSFNLNAMCPTKTLSHQFLDEGSIVEARLLSANHTK